MSVNKLVEDNMNLVYFTIRKYYPTWVGNEDVQQEGMVGLCKAAETFDESRDIKFSTYATMCVLNQIRIWLRNHMKHSNVLSYDIAIKESEGIENSLIELIVGEEDVNFDKMQFDQFYNTLDDSEKELVLMLSKYTQLEIGELSGLANNTISYRKRKLGRKWREFNNDRKN